MIEEKRPSKVWNIRPQSNVNFYLRVTPLVRQQPPPFPGAELECWRDIEGPLDIYPQGFDQRDSYNLV